MANRTLRRCPVCREVAVAEIVYGAIAFKDYLALGDGVVPGGCAIGPERWRCKACDRTWTSTSFPPP